MCDRRKIRCLGADSCIRGDTAGDRVGGDRAELGEEKHDDVKLVGSTRELREKARSRSFVGWTRW